MKLVEAISIAEKIGRGKPLERKTDTVTPGLEMMNRRAHPETRPPEARPEQAKARAAIQAAIIFNLV